MALTNSQYNFIMKIYSERQRESSRNLSEKEKQLIGSCPEYAVLDDELASLGPKIVRAKLSKDEHSAQKLTERMKAIPFEKKEVLIKYGYPVDYLKPVYVCDSCCDTGYIGTQKCHCFEELSSKIICQSSSLSGFLENASFDLINYDYYEGEDREHFKSSVSQCKDFVENFGYDYSNLLFYGTVGTGKSFLSACIAKELVDKGHSVIYFSASELFRSLSDIMFMRGDRASLEFLRDNIYNCDLLIIDDLGTELTNNATGSQFFSLINERALKKKSVIISTNLSLSELQERYTDRIFSRILSLYSIHGINGPDIRRIKRFERK